MFLEQGEKGGVVVLLKIIRRYGKALYVIIIPMNVLLCETLAKTLAVVFRT